MTLQAISVLEVAEPSLWEELQAMGPLEQHLGETLGPCQRVALPSFQREMLPRLAKGGRPVLVRYAKRTQADIEASTEIVSGQIQRLPLRTRQILWAAQRHAVDGVLVAGQVWDPVHEGPLVRELAAAELIAMAGEADPAEGRWLLNPDLPEPPALDFDFADALLDEEDDLEADERATSPVALLHDLASLAATLHLRPIKRTQSGSIAKADARWLGTRLRSELLAGGGALEEDPRWGRALRGLELLGAVSMDPIKRELFVDLGLEAVLAGTTSEAVDRLLHRVVERDLHVLLPAVRAALAQAGMGAIDDVVFVELVREQQREIVFRPWHRDGVDVYPALDEGPLRPFDDDAFDEVEARMVSALLSRLHRLGLVRVAPGVFAGTADGRRWAEVAAVEAPPIWISGDLEVIVPPDAITPWERLQLEQLTTCVGRDVVDRYRLDRSGLMAWLATHDVEDAIALLERRSPAVPATVLDSLRTWSESAQRVILTHGVLREVPAS